MKKISIFLLILVSAILVTSCKNKKNSETTEKQTITLGVMSSMDYLPVAIANAQGMFEKENVDVKIVKFFSANDRDAALQSGNLDGTIIDYTGAALQNAAGVQIYLTSQCDGTFQLLGNKDATELMNKKYAISSNTVIDFCTDMALKHNNIPLNKIERVEIQKIPLRLEMLLNNKIDFAFLPDPFVTIGTAKGCKAFISMQDLGYHVTGIVFTKNSIENKTEGIKKFYAAYNNAVEFLQTKKPEDIKDILVSEIKVPEPFVAKVVLPKFEKAQIPAQSDLNAVSNWLKGKDLLPAEYDINSMVNNQFINN